MKSNFQAKWLILGGFLISIIMLALVANFISVDQSASKLTGAIDIDNGDQKINWNKYQTYDILLKQTGPIDIAESGIYHLTGELSDGMVHIDASTTGVVKLILDNVTIRNSTGPAISCISGDDLVIELIGNNNLSDGTNYGTELDQDIDGTIYSKADLSFMGDGNLTVVGNYQDAIVGKDDIKFNSGTYNITAADDGIRGKDSVYIVSGDFNINSKANAIKSNNQTDPAKGFVLIEGGKFNISASTKGITAYNSILIQGGNFIINSYDDAIHSNEYVGITGGEIAINSGDDGIHADRELIIDGGSIDIAKSYEGLEAQAITINGGKISVVSTDDGINAGGGADSSAGGRIGANPFEADDNCKIDINGGDIYINAAGDGIDSNGYLHFNGGNVIVDGPTNNGNGALDSGSGIAIFDGSVIAIGASGMAESLGASSTVYNISAYLASVAPAGTSIKITDKNGATILEHKSAKSFNHISAGTAKFTPTATYILYIDDEKYQEFTISSIVTTIGSQGPNQNMPRGGGRR